MVVVGSLHSHHQTAASGAQFREEGAAVERMDLHSWEGGLDLGLLAVAAGAEELPVSVAALAAALADPRCGDRVVVAEGRGLAAAAVAAAIHAVVSSHSRQLSHSQVWTNHPV